MKTFRTALLALVIGFGLTGCEISNPLEDVELHLDVQDVPVELPSSVGSLALKPGETASSSGFVSNELEVTSVNEVSEIEVQPSYFHYSAGAGKTSGPAASGTVTIALFLGGVPIPGAVVEVTVTNDVVTAVSPTSIKVGTMTVDRAAVDQLLQSLPPAQRPTLADWQSMTIDQVRQKINDALASTGFDFSIVFKTTGDLAGGLTIDQFDVSASVTQAQ